MSVFAGVVICYVAADNRGDQNWIGLFALDRFDVLFVKIVLEGTTGGNGTGRVGVTALLGTFVVVAEANQYVVTSLHALQQGLILVGAGVGFGTGAGDGKVPDVYALQVKAKLGAPAVTRGVIGGVAECGCGGVAYDPDGRRCGRLVYRNAAGLLFGIGSGRCGERRIFCG